MKCLEEFDKILNIYTLCRVSLIVILLKKTLFVTFSFKVGRFFQQHRAKLLHKKLNLQGI